MIGADFLFVAQILVYAGGILSCGSSWCWLSGSPERLGDPVGERTMDARDRRSRRSRRSWRCY